MRARILLVEDDTTTRQVIATMLEDEGYTTTTAANGKLALDLLHSQRFDVVVSDIRMREIDGVEVLNVARSLRFPPEVILLTGHGSLESAIAALRAGAFNYLLKPCASAELLECVERAVQRHSAEQRRMDAMRILAQEYAALGTEPHAPAGQATLALPAAPPPAAGASPPITARFLQIGDLQLDLFRHTARFGEESLHVTPIEYAFLRCLADTPGRVYPCAEIVRHTHGYDAEETEAQVLLRAHVRNLRRKLPANYLVTVRSAGYMLVDPDEAR